MGQLVVNEKSLAFVPVNEPLTNVTVTVPLFLTVKVCAALCVPTVCAAKVKLVGEKVSCGVVVFAPVPVRPIDCGEFEALSAMLIEAVRLPVAVGRKVTLIVQLAAAATELPQVLVCVNSARLVPVTVRPVIVRAALPVLVRVTVRTLLATLICWLPKARLVGDRLTDGAALAPMPVRLTECGLPLALSVTVIVPVRVPVAVGVNVTLIEQLALAAKVLPQVVVRA